MNIPIKDVQTGEVKKNISDKMAGLGLVKYTDEIVADSAEQKSVDEIASLGWNIKGATKGPGSVLSGIEILKRYNLHIVESSINWIKEKNNYKWKVDKNDVILNEPVKSWNHLWDGLRYLALEKLAVKEVKTYVIPTVTRKYKY